MDRIRQRIQALEHDDPQNVCGAWWCLELEEVVSYGESRYNSTPSSPCEATNPQTEENTETVPTHRSVKGSFSRAVTVTTAW